MEFGGRITWEAIEERERRWQERLRASEHPAFGLGSSWRGPRALGDVHFNGDRVESVGLAHGDPLAGGSPLIHVHTTRSGEMDDVVARRAELLPGGAELPAFVPQGALVIDDQLRPTRGFEVDQGWLIRADPAPQLTVFVEGHRCTLAWFLDERELVEVDDLRPYERGRADLLRRGRP